MARPLSATALTRRFEARGVAVTDAPGGLVLFLRRLEGEASAAAALALHRDAFLAAKAAAAAFGGKGGAFVTVQDCGGDFGYGGGLSRLQPGSAG